MNIKEDEDVTLLTSLNFNPKNPRTITPRALADLARSLAEYGDLGGIVLNRTTGRLVGGHQRLAAFAQAEALATVTDRLIEPDATGTVAYGHVAMHGTRYSYREVGWSEEREAAANIAANQHGGEFDDAALAAVLKDLQASGNFDTGLNGFTDDQIAALIGGELEMPPKTKEIDITDTDLRTVQLTFTTGTLPGFMDQVQILGEHFQTGNVTETICRAVELCYKSHHEIPEAIADDSPVAPDAEQGVEE